MNIETVRYILSLIISEAHEAKQELRNDPKNEFKSGRTLAYYEVLDTVKNWCEIYGVDLGEIGLDINLEKDL